MWGRKSTSEKAGIEAENIKNQAAESAREAAENARDRYDETHSQLHDWKESVTEAATHAWDVLAHKAADLAGELAQRATESAHHVSEAARAHAEATGDVAHKKWDVVSHRAADAAQSAQSVARDKAEKAQRAANRAQTAAQIAAAGVAAQAPDAVHHAKQNALRRGGELGVKLGSALIDKSAPYAPHAVKKAKEPDWSSKLLWIGAGVFAGAVVALLLSPNSGRRNRALIKDKLNKATHEAGDLKEAAVKKAEHLSNRASGLAHDLKDRTKGNGTDAENTDETGA